jgi:hypothetical protein
LSAITLIWKINGVFHQGSWQIHDLKGASGLMTAATPSFLITEGKAFVDMKSKTKALPDLPPGGRERPVV